jgi:hypothetical protein
MVRGRVIDARTRDPIPHAQVRGPWQHAPLPADSTGRFGFPVPQGSGCVRLEVRGLGYGWTDRTVEVASGQSIDLGDIPLRFAPALEGPLLLILGCQTPVPSNAPWGVDTVLVQ